MEKFEAVGDPAISDSDGERNHQSGLLKNWSFSTWDEYRNCPYRVYLRRVERAPTSGGANDSKSEEATKRGIEAHENFAAYVSGQTEALPAPLDKIRPQIDALREEFAGGNAAVEMAMHFDSEWGEVAVGDWPNTWHISILDYRKRLDERTSHIVDLKTGKKYQNEIKHKMQLQLYAVCDMVRNPEILAVSTKCIYPDFPKEKPLEATFSRTQLGALLNAWSSRAETMLRDTVFKPNASVVTCRFCPFGTITGNGLCAYSASSDNPFYMRKARPFT